MFHKIVLLLTDARRGKLMSDAQIAAEVLFLKCESIILRQSSNPVSVCGFSMMEQVRLCAVWPRENWDRLGNRQNLAPQEGYHGWS